MLDERYSAIETNKPGEPADLKKLSSAAGSRMFAGAETERYLFDEIREEFVVLRDV